MIVTKPCGEPAQCFELGAWFVLAAFYERFNRLQPSDNIWYVPGTMVEY